MKVVQPVVVTDGSLISSSVPENDYPAWNAGTTYALGANVIHSHRKYESAANGNTGNDPALSPANWIDTGPTNRWAMFDQAVGSATGATGSLSVTLAPGVAIDAIGFLDIIGASVQVQVIVSAAIVYDQTRSVGTQGYLVFDAIPPDPSAQIIVTLDGTTGTDSVEVGTLTIGAMLDLGLTEASPSIGINDFSRRSTDDFGVTTVVERGWAKIMSVRTKLDTDDVDVVQVKVAALRATPALWLGEDGYDSMAIFGFYKDFSIDLALPSISYCTLRIEGLT